MTTTLTHCTLRNEDKFEQIYRNTTSFRRILPCSFSLTRALTNDQEGGLVAAEDIHPVEDNLAELGNRPVEGDNLLAELDIHLGEVGNLLAGGDNLLAEGDNLPGIKEDLAVGILEEDSPDGNLVEEDSHLEGGNHRAAEDNLLEEGNRLGAASTE